MTTARDRALWHIDRNRHLVAWRHELAFPRSSVAYTYIPKNACSTLKLSLGYHEGWLSRDTSNPHGIGVGHRLYGKLRVLDPALRLLVLRDPYERTVSAFLDRFMKQPLDRGPRLLLQSGSLPSEPAGGELRGVDHISFRDFVGVLAGQGLRMDPHWRPQSDFVKGAYSHVCSTRNLWPIQDALQSMGVEWLDYRPHRATSASGLGIPASDLTIRQLREYRSEGALPSSTEMLPADLRLEIEKVFASDFSLLRQFELI